VSWIRRSWRKAATTSKTASQATPQLGGAGRRAAPDGLGGATDEGQLNGVALAVARVGEGDAVPRPVRVDHCAERIRRRDRLPTDARDHVACAQARLGRGSVGADADDAGRCGGAAELDAEVRMLGLPARD